MRRGISGVSSGVSSVRDSVQSGSPPCRTRIAETPVFVGFCAMLHFGASQSGRIKSPLLCQLSYVPTVGFNMLHQKRVRRTPLSFCAFCVLGVVPWLSFAPAGGLWDETLLSRFVKRPQAMAGSVKWAGSRGAQAFGFKDFFHSPATSPSLSRRRCWRFRHPAGR